MRKDLCFLVAIPVFAGIAVAQQQPTKHFDGSSWWEQVEFLADDNLEGRETGSEGLRKAEAYIVERLNRAGLQPAGVNGFYQPVRFVSREIIENLRQRWFLVVRPSRLSLATMPTSIRASISRLKKLLILSYLSVTACKFRRQTTMISPDWI